MRTARAAENAGLQRQPATFPPARADDVAVMGSFAAELAVIALGGRIARLDDILFRGGAAEAGVQTQINRLEQAFGKAN